MTSPLLRKLGFKRGMRTILIGAPAEVRPSIDINGDDLARKLAGSFDYIHLFVKDHEALDAKFPQMKRHLEKKGMLWVSWPKGGRLGTDLNLKKVIGIGYSHGLVESKTISVDPTWSAIKFTFPKEGKVYNNSYGRLEKGR
jgi:hypothetical protein